MREPDVRVRAVRRVLLRAGVARSGVGLGRTWRRVGPWRGFENSRFLTGLGARFDCITTLDRRE